MKKTITVLVSTLALVLGTSCETDDETYVSRQTTTETSSTPYSPYGTSSTTRTTRTTIVSEDD